MNPSLNRVACFSFRVRLAVVNRPFASKSMKVIFFFFFFSFFFVLTFAWQKKGEEEEEGPRLGKVGTHLKCGIVGVRVTCFFFCPFFVSHRGLFQLPNVGKSTLFNVLTKMGVPAENFPFCTIDPATSRVNVPDERFDFLVETFKPKSAVKAFLEITDIAG